MRPITFLVSAALVFATAAHAAPKTPTRTDQKTTQTTPALPGTIHFGPDPKTGKWKRLSDRQVAPRTPGVAALEKNARRDGTRGH